MVKPSKIHGAVSIRCAECGGERIVLNGQEKKCDKCDSHNVEVTGSIMN